MRAEASTAAPIFDLVPYTEAPEAIKVMVPSVAPLDNPMRVGSAKGFLKIPCATDPATPNPAPIITAPNARGNLTCQTVVASTPSLPISEKTEL